LLAHENTGTVSRKIWYTARKIYVAIVLYANNKRGPSQPRRDALRLPNFAEKKSGLNDAFRALLLYKEILRTLFLGVRRSASTLERSKHHITVRFFSVFRLWNERIRK